MDNASKVFPQITLLKQRLNQFYPNAG